MVALAMLGSAATVTVAWSIAYFISQIFIAHAAFESVTFCLGWVLGGGLVKAIVLWVQEFYATRAAAAVEAELRHKLFDAINGLGPAWLAKRSVAEINLLATSGLDALEPYFAKYLPQLVYTALVTPALLAIIWFSDLSSGVTLLITLPLIPVFMILIGWATGSVQQRQLESLTRLSQHFLEVLRGMTTLKIFGRVEAQHETLERVSLEHRRRTMRVLRVSFLSGFALELLASLAVALMAVSIGLRLLSGDLSLMVGLFVLLLAPEAYLPIRQVGAQFHASAGGVAASKGILDIIDEARNPADKLPQPRFTLKEFTDGTLTVITGPSGIGKSTILAELLAQSNSCAWMPQANKLFAGSVAENICGPNQKQDSNALAEAMLLAVLDDLPSDYEVGEAGAKVSGGQAQRICLARAIYRTQLAHSDYLLLDEPISALDEVRAAGVVSNLRAITESGVTVIAISHQDSLVRAAHRVIEVQSV